MLESLIDHVGRLGQWSYLIVFVAATLESAAFVGLVVPGDTICLLAGFLASTYVLDLPETIVVAAVGAALGDSIGFEMGRRLGRPWLQRHGARFGVNPERLRRVEELFEEHGGKTVFLARFVAFLRSTAPFVAGSSRMPYGRFVVFNVAGAILWACGVVLLGYFLGASWQMAEQWIGRAALILFAVVVGSLLVWFRRRTRRAVEGNPPR